MQIDIKFECGVCGACLESLLIFLGNDSGGECVCVCVCSEQMYYLLIGYALTHILKIACNVLHCGVAQQDTSKVFLTDGGHSLGITEELNLKDFCLQVVHESADRA